MACGFSSSKLTQFIGDGFEYMKEHENEFDVIITDSSDPVGKFSAMQAQKETYSSNFIIIIIILFFFRERERGREGEREKFPLIRSCGEDAMIFNIMLLCITLCPQNDVTSHLICINQNLE